MPDLDGPSGVAVWESDTWRVTALAWMDDRLAAAGIARLGDVEQPRVRPWATVLRAPTTIGPVWMKAAAADTAYEVGLYDVLVDVVPDGVITPIATDAGRGWLLLPDGGPTLGDRTAGADRRAEQVAGLVDAVVRYGALQRACRGGVPRLLDAGVPDMRPARMCERFDEAVAATERFVENHGTPADRAAHARVVALRSEFAGWCDRLSSSSLSASIDHNDLHPGNVLGAGPDTRFYDWGDAVVAHPFAAMLVPLRYVAHLLDCDIHDDRVRDARDAYLDGFAALAPDEDLAATLDVACRVAEVARALTWERAVAAARRDGVAVDDQWARAPLETLLSVLGDPPRRDQSVMCS